VLQGTAFLLILASETLYGRFKFFSHAPAPTPSPSPSRAEAPQPVPQRAAAT